MNRKHILNKKDFKRVKTLNHDRNLKHANEYRYKVNTKRQTKKNLRKFLVYENNQFHQIVNIGFSSIL